MPEFTIDESAPILIEFDVGSGVRKVSRAGKDMDALAKKSKQALDHAMNTIHHMARRVSATIDSLDPVAARPSEVEASFALKLETEVGAVIAKAGLGAEINVKLIWKSQKGDS